MMIEHYEATGMILTGVIILIFICGAILALKIKEMYLD